MFSKDNIICNLKKRCHVEFTVSSEPVKRLKGFLFLEKDAALDKDMAYIVPYGWLEDLFDSDVSGMTLICPAHDGKKLIEEYSDRIPKNTALIFPDISVAELINVLITLYREESKLAKNYQAAADAETSLAELARIASERLGVSVVFLSHSYVQLAACFSGDTEERIKDLLKKQEGQDTSVVREFVDQMRLVTDRRDHSYYEISESSEKCMVGHITLENSIAAHILFILGEYPNPNYYLSEMDQVAFYVEKVLRKQASNDVLYGPFNELVNQIIDGGALGRDEVLERLSHLPQPGYGERFRFILVSFDDVVPDYRWTYIANQARNIFPLSNIAKYGPNLLVFTRSDLNNPDAVETNRLFSREKFSAFLEEHNAYAAIGASSKYLSAAHTMYQQCHATVRLAKKLRRDKTERIFNYEDYSVYLFVEMCADDHFKDFHHGRLFYLCHQDILTLARYDRRNNTDLLDVLYAYLANNCKVTQTARELYMHRNTLISKVEKIEQIIAKDLDNSSLRERFLFSYHVIEYCRDYLGQDVFPSSIID